MRFASLTITYKVKVTIILKRRCVKDFTVSTWNIYKELFKSFMDIFLTLKFLRSHLRLEKLELISLKADKRYVV
jgi:hypothetical protein